MSTRKPKLFELLPVDVPQLQLITVSPKQVNGPAQPRVTHADLVDLEQQSVRRPPKSRLH